MSLLLKTFKTPVTILALMIIGLIILCFILNTKNKDCVLAHAPYTAMMLHDGFHIALLVKDREDFLYKSQVYHASSMQTRHCRCIVVFESHHQRPYSIGTIQVGEQFVSDIRCFDCRDSLDNKGD